MISNLSALIRNASMYPFPLWYGFFVSLFRPNQPIALTLSELHNTQTLDMFPNTSLLRNKNDNVLCQIWCPKDQTKLRNSVVNMCSKRVCIPNTFICIYTWCICTGKIYFKELWFKQSIWWKSKHCRMMIAISHYYTKNIKNCCK